MTDPTEIARSAIEVQAYEMAMALGDLLIGYYLGFYDAKAKIYDRLRKIL